MVESALDVADVLELSAEHEQAVTFDYVKDGESYPGIARTFSPWELTAEGEKVLGWDHRRDGIREFRVAQIFNVVSVDEDYVVPT